MAKWLLFCCAYGSAFQSGVYNGQNVLTGIGLNGHRKIMSEDDMMEMVLFGLVAVLILGRLFLILGQNRGAPPAFTRPDQSVDGKHDRPDGNRGSGPMGQPVNRAPQSDQSDWLSAVAAKDPAILSGDVKGLSLVEAHDPRFDARQFLAGAREAYVMVVSAFGRADRGQLGSLLTEALLAEYEPILAAREAEKAAPIQVARISESVLEAGRVEDGVAQIDVRFDANLKDGGDGLRLAEEVWTFERTLGTKDQMWRLSAVEPVTA